MRFTAEYPIERLGPHSADFHSGAALAAFARAAEDAGFDALAFAEHPAPSVRWFAGGGHDTFDPVAALSFCAAATSSIRLLTNVLVLPYRNPLLLAKSLATLDLLSDGRLIIGAGTGYLRSEFAAVGVDFDERNALFDEAVMAMRGYWDSAGFRFDGRHFRALGQTCRPAPSQRPFPPLWIGGNGVAARRRVAEFGQGWTPMLADPVLARTIRSAALPDVDALAVAVADLRQRLLDHGRDPAGIDVHLDAPGEARADGVVDLNGHLAALRGLAAAGVTWVLVHVQSDSVPDAVAALHRYRDQVIDPVRAELCDSKS